MLDEKRRNFWIREKHTLVKWLLKTKELSVTEIYRETQHVQDSERSVHTACKQD